MATVTSLGFNIFSKYNGKGVAAARRDLDALARKSPKVTVQVSTAEATKKINAFKAKVDSLAKKSASIKVKADTGKAATDISAISAKVSALSKKSANIKVKADTSQASKALSVLSAKVSKLGNRTVRINVDVDRAMAAINSFATRLRAIKDFTVHVRVDFTQLLALEQVLAVLGRRRIHIPVEVDEEPIERLFSGITRVGNESERTGHRLRGSMSRSNTSVRGLIKSFDAFQGSQMAMLRLALLLGPALVGGLGAGAVAIHQAIVALSAAAGGAAVFALALRNVANIAGSQVAVQITRAKAAVNSFGTGSAHIIGRVMVHAVNAFINILHAVEPAVRPVSKVFLSIAKDIENFTKSPALKAFTGWFKVMAPAAITSLWGTFKVFAEGMYHFLGRIGAFNGQVFLDWLNRSANAFNRWSQGGGPERMKKFFDQWAPVLIQAAKGLLQLAGAMGKALNPAIIILVGWLGKFSGWLAELINQHPILGQVLAGVILGYKLLGVAISITDHVMDMLNSRLVRNTGAWIANKAQVLASKAAQAGKWLMNSAEFLSIQTANLVRNTAAWIANKAQVLASKAVSIASSIWSAVTALAAQTGALIKNVALWVAQRVALVASRAVMIAIRVATLAWAAAQWLLNAALAANPIGLIVIALVALVAGLVLAYKKSETFRNIVNGAWNIVKIGALAMWNVLKIIFNAMVGAFSNTGGWATRFKNGIIGAFNAIRSGVVTAWSATWNALRAVVNGAWAAIRTTVSVMGGWIRGAFNSMRSGIGSAWGAVWTFLRNVVSSAWNHIRTTVALMGSWIRSAFNSMRTGIGSAWSAVWGFVRNILSSAWSHIRTTVGSMAGWMGAAFRRIRAAVGGVWNATWGWMRNAFNFAWGKIRGSISVMISWLTTAFRVIRNNIGGWWNRAWSWIRSIFNFAWGKIRGSINVMGQWLGNKFHAIRNSIGSWWNKAWSWIRSIFNFAWGKIRGSVTVMGQWLGNKFHAIRNSIGSWWNKAWTWIRSIFNFAWGKLRGSLTIMGQWLGNKFHAIRNSIGSWWNKGWRWILDIFNFAWGKLRGSMRVMEKTMAGIWHAIVNTAGHIWDGIKKVIGRPINFVIGFVADRLIPFANKALKMVLGGKAPQINGGALKGYKIPGVATGGVIGSSGIDRGYAAGGVLPGYTPGRDVHIAQSPMGPIGLSGGEGILRPEVMRIPGMKDFLHSANAAARMGGLSNVKAKMSKGFRQSRDTNPPAEGAMFAKGGMVGKTPVAAKFDGGGLFDKIKNIAKFVIPGVGAADMVKKKIQEKGFAMILEKVMGKVYKSALSWFKDMGPAGLLVGGTMAKVVSAIVGWVSGKINPGGGGNWTVTGKGLQNAINFAKSQSGKPYQWGGGGNPSYDCSGFMASIERVMTGRGPGRLYTTHNFHGKTAPSGWKAGLNSPFMVGVTDAGVGHMAGTLAGHRVESSGSNGVRFDGVARGHDNPMFKWRYGYQPATKMATQGGSGGGGSAGGGFLGGSLASMGTGGGGGGGGRAYFTHFWDPQTASGKPMTRDTIASSYIPLGSRLSVSKGGKSATGWVNDLGPAKFVYDRHPGIAVLDLAEGMLPGDGYGNFNILSVGSGRTLYGKNLRGYAKGGTIGASQPALVGEGGAEVIFNKTRAHVAKSGSTVSVGDTHVHFHDKVYAKSEREFRDMVVTAISEAKRKRKI